MTTPISLKFQEMSRFFTPAKVNPFLFVEKRRGDGFHEVQLAMVAVSLYDEMTLELRKKDNAEPEVIFSVKGNPTLAEEADNLVSKAARLFLGAVEAPSTVQVRLELTKNNPVGAGLGGGSANGAGTLMALNTLWGHPLEMPRLVALAAELGADVPFFLTCKPALATGTGTTLAPLPEFPHWPLVVIKPPFGVSTKTAYGRLTPIPAPPGLALVAKAEGFWAPASKPNPHLHNAFEAALFPLYPELAEGKQALLDAGANGALLSGSGSALFGVFANEEAQQQAVKTLQAKWDGEWKVLPCHTLNGHRFL